MAKMDQASGFKRLQMLINGYILNIQKLKAERGIVEI